MATRMRRGRGRYQGGVPALCSAVVWGSGQILNRQVGKGLIFLTSFVGVVTSEVVTGHYLLGGRDYSPRANGGWIVHGLWGLVTLGTRPRTMTTSGLTSGDNSVTLLADGMITLFGVLLLVALWWWNVRDAWTTARERAGGRPTASTRQWLRSLWQRSTAYVMLTPSALLVLFVSVLPIVFGILIAFTSYDRDHTPPAHLVRWVGLDNFTTVLRVGSWARTFAGGS